MLAEIIIFVIILIAVLIWQKYESGKSNNQNGVRGDIMPKHTAIPARVRQNVYYTSQYPSALTNNPYENMAPVSRPLVPASMDNITETGPMIYFANDRHGRRDKEYRFNYKKASDGWRAYIVKMPDLNGRDSSLAKTHRHTENGSYYICWDSPVNTLKDMQTISRKWADCIQEYISSGEFRS